MYSTVMQNDECKVPNKKQATKRVSAVSIKLVRDCIKNVK
ncbi:UNVERIFIED_ORG: hypothetical protein ABIC81_004297 [Bacillus proteolyticus]